PMANLAYICDFLAVGLTLASYMMKSMLPLRIVALASNLLFVAYGLLEGPVPSLILYLAMIPINVQKVLEIRHLIRAVEQAQADSPVADWLLPHMQRREARAGEVLWRQGERATEMLYLQAGSLRLQEIGELLGPGTLVGEIGLFTPDRRRTLSLVCETDCTLYSLSAEAMAQLHFQNPALGFHVMQLIVARLLRDVERSRESGEAALAG
ncbi:MAG TPA: cyclic nucleotide-binding domain-containing protein, partial [Burkholderiaceae bacterium]